MKKWMIVMMGIGAATVAFVASAKTRNARRLRQIERNKRKLPHSPASQQSADNKLRYVEKLEAAGRQQPVLIKGDLTRSDSSFNNN